MHASMLEIIIALLPQPLLLRLLCKIERSGASVTRRRRREKRASARDAGVRAVRVGPAH